MAKQQEAQNFPLAHTLPNDGSYEVGFIVPRSSWLLDKREEGRRQLTLDCFAL